MSTAVFEIEQELVDKAEDILSEIGMSYPDAVKLFTKQIIVRNAFPIELRAMDRPPVPCIDDMTDEELDDLIQEALDEIEAGHTYTLDEAKEILGVK